MSALKKLTEGIVGRDLNKEGAALATKWERTGLLEGIDDDEKRNTMCRLLENQAKELLREASRGWSVCVEQRLRFPDCFGCCAFDCELFWFIWWWCGCVRRRFDRAR